MIRTLVAALAFVAFALAGTARAQEASPLFASDEPIRLVIQAPLGQLMRDRDNSVPVDGILTDPHGQQLQVRLALRGITRRKAETCDFPPLRVDFTAPPPPTTLFAGQRRLKLVTHCRNSASFQQHVLLEYAAYRLFNVLSPRSFRVRLANIDYVAPDRRTIASRVGFFIEELADVARRNGTREAHAPDVFPAAYLSPLDSARYALFQHMIANHDWSMRAGPPGEECCHNAKMLGAQAPGQTIPVPYDFDYSGFVSAPYALPPSELRLNSVRQRLYRGYCIYNDAAFAAAAEFRAAKPQLVAAIASIPGLEPRTQQRAMGFIEPFFADIATDQTLAAKVLSRCVR